MKRITGFSTAIYFSISLGISICSLLYLILPRCLMLISYKKGTVKIDKLYRDNLYGENYVGYTYLNQFNRETYSIYKTLDYDQFTLLEGEKYIVIQYSEYLPKYSIIEALGDSDYKIGLFLLLIIVLSFFTTKNYKV